MADTAEQTLKAFLVDRAGRVRDLEAEAAEIIHDQGDQRGYEAKMAEKAELLADLAGEAEPLLAGVDPDKAQAVGARLQNFSGNAARSLQIGSVFYMSALLYPDDHREGEPNNLERLISETFPD